MHKVQLFNNDVLILNSGDKCITNYHIKGGYTKWCKRRCTCASYDSTNTQQRHIYIVQYYYVDMYVYLEIKIPWNFMLLHINQDWCILQPETVFPLKNDLAPQKPTLKWMYIAAKPQSSGLFSGKVTGKLSLLSFLCVFICMLYTIHVCTQ